MAESRCGATIACHGDVTPQRRTLQGSAARRALLRGADRMAGVLRPTLGPLARTIAIGAMFGNQPPEVLDNAATIARRTLEVEDPFEDMGAKLIRHVAWRTFDLVGDGSATAAVLAHALVRAGLSYVCAGGNPVAVRRGMERGLVVACDALHKQARTIDGPTEIAGVVRGTIRDAELATMLGEVLDAAGPDGAVLVEDSQSTRTTHTYLDGVRWNEGYLSSFLLRKDQTSGVRMMNPRILVTDFELVRAEDVLSTVEACVGAGERNLFIIAPDIRDSAVGLLVVNRERGLLEGAIAVRAPSIGDQRIEILEDLAVTSGGKFVSQARGDRLADVTIDDLGRARQAWATRVAFGLLGGSGTRERIRQRIATARTELTFVQKNDAFSKGKIQERIGKLAGTSAVIHVGAPTGAERAELKLRIEAAVRSGRSALQSGVVAGGGAALLGCIPALEAMQLEGDQGVGVDALARALAEPLRTIVSNAGFEPAPIVHRTRTCDLVYDVVKQTWVNAWTTGLIDPLAVVETALETSVSSAALALTSEVLIHRKNPPVILEP